MFSNFCVSFQMIYILHGDIWLSDMLNKPLLTLELQPDLCI